MFNLHDTSGSTRSFRARLAVLAVFFLFSTLSVKAYDTLEAFRWNHRVLLLRAEADSPLKRQLEGASDECVQRQLVWFVFSQEGVATNYAQALPDDFIQIVKKSYFSQSDQNVVLIGKDGGVKLRAKSLDITAVFGLVDSMPMRKREIKRLEQQDSSDR